MALRAWLFGTGLLALLLSGIAIALLSAAMAGTPPLADRPRCDWNAALGFRDGHGVKGKDDRVDIGVDRCHDGWTADDGLGVIRPITGVAIATLASTGYGVMDESSTGWVHLAADILHLLSAGAWVGALLGLGLLVTRPAGCIDTAHLMLTHRALQWFGLVGTIVVGAIVVIGLINAWPLVDLDHLPNLGATVYHRPLIAKLALFGAVLGLAALNCFRLTPAFERSIATTDRCAAIAGLRRSLLTEAVCAATILALVAWLVTLESPASAM